MKCQGENSNAWDDARFSAEIEAQCWQSNQENKKRIGEDIIISSFGMLQMRNSYLIPKVLLKTPTLRLERDGESESISTTPPATPTTTRMGRAMVGGGGGGGKIASGSN